MPLTETQLLALNKVRVAQETTLAAKAKGSGGRRPLGCMHKVPCSTHAPRGKAGWMPTQKPLVLKPEYEGIKPSMLKGISAMRELQDEAITFRTQSGGHGPEFNPDAVHKTTGGKAGKASWPSGWQMNKEELAEAGYQPMPKQGPQFYKEPAVTGRSAYRQSK